MRRAAAIYLALLMALSGIVINSTSAAENRVTFSAFVPASAGALTFGPKRAYADGFGNSAGLRLQVGNNSSQPRKLRFEAFDAKFMPISTVNLPEPITLYPGDTRTFLAIVPIMEDVKNRVRICAVLKSSNAQENRLCGRYIARKR